MTNRGFTLKKISVPRINSKNGNREGVTLGDKLKSRDTCSDTPCMNKNRYLFIIFIKLFLFIYKITHAINRYIKLEYDITSGENIEDAIKDLADTHVAHIQPDRSQGL